ncbi:PRC and DUF2382 domain-containing protein [uncultured Jatrophihabitans sp.]|uniref:PRC and DUF2382 domain-containing protein n=1 Tax=uncultured Jatrophihabitans sp. TaxID=1610747 RepID=UPI0035C96B4D
MTNTQNVQDLIGRTAVDPDGDKIGKIEQVYLDDQTSVPQWVTVSTGMFGKKESFAPLHGSHMTGDDLTLAVSKDLVKTAPNMDADGHLGDSENDALYDHYAGHLGTETGHDAAGEAGQTDGLRSDDRGDTSGPNTDDAMTRSEERLRVGTQSGESGRATLRKYVVTENVSTTVPVSHEEVRVDREPITDANRGDAMSGGDITEEEHEITLHAEQPVVSKETVPVERVRMSAETVTEDHEVNEQVRKEQIDTPDSDAR